MGFPFERLQRMSKRRSALSPFQMKFILLPASLIFLAIGVWLYRGPAWQLNRAAVEALQAAAQGNPAGMAEAAGRMQGLGERADWLRGAIALRAGNTDAAAVYWMEMLARSPLRVSLLAAALGPNEDVARFAASRWPDSPTALFWLAESVVQKDPAAALTLYARVTALQPGNGLAWCRQGALERNAKRLDAALVHFQNCCLNGDPGSNGCYGTGLILEQSGQWREAIRWYRLAHWEGAFARADALENKLNNP